ncbi:nucleoside triphosphate pyrophosphohydrolase [Desulfovibrio legallii]|uniref:ATP diphosphatase n=1 Tax=Desulfovibrio legallii TaxID=571438 RepID=A0A1G7LSX0_9BACT|nr:nucleoside triphosphate pyrophosphohydrolase [Desulfovibrio legallii]SDF52070.1 ATP diphosphatase [Desulfovibrio legallii]
MEPTALEALQALIDRLTAPDGCPWDKEQTPQSLADYIIEESHELVSAIRSGNVADIREELGDVAFLLLFVARLYERQGQFSLDDALNNNRAKMVRRHPHVFGDATFDSRDAQLAAWEQIKRAEHQDAAGKPQGLYASLPASLPPLIKAYRINSKAARVGFTWQEDEEVEQQVEAEWLEWLDASANGDQEAQKHELGDLLFSITELGRRKGIKASEALDLAAIRFLRRFAAMEAMAAAQGKDFAALSLDEKDALWNAAKAQETADAPQAAGAADASSARPRREVGAPSPEAEKD